MAESGTPAARPLWRRLTLRGDRLHPAWRAALYVLGLLAVEVVAAFLLGLIYSVRLLLAEPPSADEWTLMAAGRLPAWLALVHGLLRLGGILGLALVLGRQLDREPVETMGFGQRRSTADSLLGLGLGLVAMLVVGGIKLALGWSDVAPGTSGVGAFLLDAAALLPLAAAEEVAFRGYLLRAIGSWRGAVVGTAVTSVLFAMFHGRNPNVSPLALLNILLAGAVFALAAERTGTLWLAIGYHFAWNLAQGPLLGMPVSGMPWAGLLALGEGGPRLWTGGEFGPEGGLLSTAILLVSILPLWALTRRPSSVAAACRRQRAAMETHFGPLPHLHHRLEVGKGFFNDMARSPRGGRMGEVVLLLRRPDGNLLLHTKRFYPAGTYRLPSGGIQQGEKVTDAAHRETSEEATLSARGARPAGLLTYTLQSGRRRLFFHSWPVLAEVQGDPTVSDERERIDDFRWVEPRSLPEVAQQLAALPAAWASWGRFRAAAHYAAARWIPQANDSQG